MPLGWRRCRIVVGHQFRRDLFHIVQEGEGILGLPLHAQFEMEVGTCGVTGPADLGDLLPPLHNIALAGEIDPVMGIQGLDPVAVFHD